MKPSQTTMPSPMRWITHAALTLALAMLIARITTSDALRDPWQVAPGNQLFPPSPGPSTALVYDLLACLPALLVLLRGAIDKSFRLSMHWSHLLLFTLAGLAVLSTAWSVDRFAAAVTSAHFFTAACLLWAMSQLIRTPDRFRLVCSLAFGLLLVLATRTMLYRCMDVPQNITYWNENKTQILKDRNINPDSFEAKQLEHKLVSGELLAFFTSANTVAAVAVLLFAACVGIGIQKVRDGENEKWLILPGIAMLLLVWILLNARSKTSAGTPLVGIGALGLFLFLRSQNTPPRKSFLAGLGLILLTIIAVVGHGIYHHGLFAGHFSNSLDFRWKYWVASAGIFREHPLFGVGWGNFGCYYLAHRLPEAAEAVKDPHNFLVHFLTELGIIGGLVCIAWVIRLSWEITCSAKSASEDLPPDEPLGVKTIIVIVTLGTGIAIAATIDLALPFGDMLTLMLVPVLYLLALSLGTMAGSIRSEKTWLLDDRPAPWIFYCTVTGLGLFLLHNLIDFSWFETGPMFLFMTLIGASHGIAAPVPTQKKSRWPAITAGGAGGLLWLGAMVVFVVPVMAAEQSAIEADELIRTASPADPSQAIAHFRHAADKLQNACQLVPYNVDYLYRQAETRERMGDSTRAQALLNTAKRINPRQIDPYLLDANIQLHQSNPNSALIRSDFSTIFQLDPNNIALRIQFGQALEQLGSHAEACGQYRLALQANDALPTGEPTRLTTDEVTELKKKAGT